ncbi:MAG TPA: ABC transporter ATP-binding protein, partial [Acidimicrobiales bacterium]|nr:ABC transporter ATP-binding protein [Acidimicrobiales bacterium]
MIELRGIGHVYSRNTPWARRALEAVDLDIDVGQGVLVVGANGSGKSTLAWILAGLIVPWEGTATIDGEPLDKAGDKVAISFQHSRLQLFRPTVAADIAWSRGVSDDDVDPALRFVGLDPAVVRERRIDELSGGQQRRVALAGLLARRPELIVLDEPFSGLDSQGRTTLWAVLGRMRSNGTSVVVVSHDYEGAPE